MNNCYECDSCKIITSASHMGFSRARCTVFKNPKCGKSITWACTLVKNDHFNKIQDTKIIAYGKDRVINFLKEGGIPEWCPLSK